MYAQQFMLLKIKNGPHLGLSLGDPSDAILMTRLPYTARSRFHAGFSLIKLSANCTNNIEVVGSPDSWHLKSLSSCN